MQRLHPFRRSALLAFGLLLCLLAVPVVLTWRAWRQEKLDQALFRAMRSHNRMASHALLKQGANPNARLAATSSAWWRMLSEQWRGHQNTGSLALFFALRQEPEFVPDLLNAGADCNAEDHGLTALDEVPETDDRCLEALLQHGVRVDKPLLLTGYTILCEAAVEGNLKRTQLLLNYHANVNAQDGQGISPLMYACASENPVIVSLLLKHGASVNLREHSGMTALTLVQKAQKDTTNPLKTMEKAQCEQIVRLLRQAGAKE